MVFFQRKRELFFSDPCDPPGKETLLLGTRATRQPGWEGRAPLTPDRVQPCFVPSGLMGFGSDGSPSGAAASEAHLSRSVTCACHWSERRNVAMEGCEKPEADRPAVSTERLLPPSGRWAGT